MLLVAWTTLIGSITIINVRNEYKTTEALLLFQHRLSTIVIKTSWRWNASHGGVFVPANGEITPSPYLAEEDRSILISTGGDTLVNIPPTVMSAQTYALSGMQDSFDSRVVSIRPLNPANSADEWEASAIKDFEKVVAEGSPEVTPFMFDRYSFSDINGGNPEFRFISAIIAEESCLSCHNHGIAEGQVMGGFSYTITNKAFIDWFRGESKHLVSSGIFIWILGCIGIVLIMKNISTRLQKEMTLKKFEGVLEMAGSAAHELNQPLQVISGYAELIAVLDPNDREMMLNMMKSIRENVFRLSAVTRKLNGITRYETIELTARDRIIDLDKSASGIG